MLKAAAPQKWWSSRNSRKGIAFGGLSFFIFWSVAGMAHSQVPAEVKRSVRAVRFETPPTIDGLPDDPVWQEAESSGEFIQFEPRHGEAASTGSEFKVGFDEHALYVLILFSDPEPDQAAAAVTGRDGELGRR